MRPIARKIDPYRRMNRQHPFDVWRALFALRLRDGLIGIDGQFYTPNEIAEVLYSNFSHLSPRDQNRVLAVKLKFPLNCLSFNGFIEEDKTFLPKTYMNNYNSWEDIRRPVWQHNNKFRARNIFRLRGIDYQESMDITY